MAKLIPMKNIRYYAFWLKDFLTNGKVRMHYNEIKSVYRKKVNTDDYQNKRLRTILNYAKVNTKFYKKYNPDDLKSFPIINKQDIIKADKSIFSKEFSKSKLRVMSTSGSSGTPFQMFQDKNKVARNNADLIFFYELGDYYIGDRFYFMRIWNSINKKSNLQAFIQNLKMIDTSNISISGAKRFKEDMLEDKKNKVILAYASSFTSLMEHISDKLDWKIKSIFTGAEELPIPVKRKMESVFQCPVISRYSNQENGLLAQQPMGKDYFILNDASYFFEFLKPDKDEPANEGEICRIVVTDLFNKAVPVIRYDTADLCTFKKVDNNIIIEKIHGRKVDFLKLNSGEVLSPHTITNLMWNYPELSEWQFIQNSLIDYTFTLVYKNTDKKQHYENSLNNEIKKLFGFESTVNFVEVEHIPLEKSGKRKYIVSHVI